MPERLVNHLEHGVLGAVILASVVLAQVQVSHPQPRRVDPGPAYALALSPLLRVGCATTWAPVLPCGRGGTGTITDSWR
jgi:hypothetical protein